MLSSKVLKPFHSETSVTYTAVCQQLFDHRITEWAKLEGTSGDHLVQSRCSKQSHQEQVV